MPINILFNTDGRGQWSRTQKEVLITDMQLSIAPEDGISELRVYFDPNTWPVSEYGLIYTDIRFLKDVREYLSWWGLPRKEVHYSEQGMQGDDYVSFDVGKPFVKAWVKKGLPTS